MLLDCYNTTLRSLLDDHAPVCSRHVSTRPRPPWFNEDIIQACRDRRKAERRWRASSLQADLVVFKAKWNYVIHLTRKSNEHHNWEHKLLHSLIHVIQAELLVEQPNKIHVLRITCDWVASPVKAIPVHFLSNHGTQTRVKLKASWSTKYKHNCQLRQQTRP